MLPSSTHTRLRACFAFPGRGRHHPSPQHLFYCFLFVPTLFCFSPWRPTADVASGAIMCLFYWGGIPYLTRQYYRGSLRVLSSGPPSTIISPSSHHLCLPLPSFAVPSYPASTPRLHPPPPSPSSQNICRPPSSSSLSSYSAPLCLSIFCHHFHPRQNPRVFSAAPPYVLLSDPPLAAIISPSPQRLCLPLICATPKI